MTRRTLKLTSWYMPIQIMSWQDAISDVYLGRVVPVVDYDAEVRSPSTVMKIPAVVRIPRATGTIKRGIKFSKLNVAARDQYRCQYCLSPDHRVLTAGLRWVSLGDLGVGDQLVGFDESAGYGMLRRFKTSVVEEIRLTRAPLFRVVLDDGTVFRATIDHRWLVYKSQALRWRTTKQLKPGRRVPRLFDLWSDLTSWDAGWLAGMFDGEGWLETTTNLGIAVGQNPGYCYDRISALVAVFGFDYSSTQVNTDRDCHRLRILGAASDKSRFLGSVRPRRLLDQFRPEMLGALRARSVAAVECVESAGSGEIVEIRTSTGTLVVEGFPHHNCLTKLPVSKITYDHVFPKSRGGETTWDNVVSACSECNSRKDNKTPEEAGMRLHTVPRRPHSLPVEPLRLKDMPGIPEQWLEFAVA